MRTIHRDIAGAFIFSSDNQILLGKTRKGGAYRDMWVVPGGGVEEGETKLEALKREIKEELGLEITDDQIEVIDEPSSGESEKLLKDTNEKVLVKMTFWDFKIQMPQEAAKVVLSLDDDLAEARFFAVGELATLDLGGGTEASFKRMGLL